MLAVENLSEVQPLRITLSRFAVFSVFVVVLLFIWRVQKSLPENFRASDADLEQ